MACLFIIIHECVRSIRTMSTGIMNDLDIDDYGFNRDNIAVAAMLKSYWNLMTREGAFDTLETIVNVGIRELPMSHGGGIRIRELDIPKETCLI